MPAKPFNLKARKSGTDAPVISLDSPDLSQNSDPNRLNYPIDKQTWEEDAQVWHELYRASQPKRPAGPDLGNPDSPLGSHTGTESVVVIPRRVQADDYGEDADSVASSGRTPTGPIAESPKKKPRIDDKDLEDDGKDFSSPTQEFEQPDLFKETLADPSLEPPLLLQLMMEMALVESSRLPVLEMMVKI